MGGRSLYRQFSVKERRQEDSGEFFWTHFRKLGRRFQSSLVDAMADCQLHTGDVDHKEEHARGTSGKNGLTSVAKAAPIIDIDPINRPAICIHILHCPYAVNTLSLAHPFARYYLTHGPDRAATIYSNPVCSVEANVIVLVPLPGNSSSVQ